MVNKIEKLQKIYVDNQGNVIVRKPGRPRKDDPVLTELFIDSQGNITRKVGRPNLNSFNPEGYVLNEDKTKLVKLETATSNKEAEPESKLDIEEASKLEEVKQEENKSDLEENLEESKLDNEISNKDVIEDKLETSSYKEIKQEDVEIKLDNTPKKVDYSKNDVLLKVKHLKQYFRYKGGDTKYLKAVHDISFDVHRGEVFGLVGESGCGKTTTGRDILKLYKITSGDIYLDGIRISAGTRWNEKEIKYTNIRLNEALKRLKIEKKNKLTQLSLDYSNKFDENFNPSKLEKSLSSKDAKALTNSELADKFDNQDKTLYLDKYKQIVKEYETQVEKEKQHAKKICDEQREVIKKAKYDNSHYLKAISEAEVKKVDEKYADLLARYKENKDNLSTEDQALYEEYKKEYKKAKATNLANKVQMIFQDPIASLNPRMTVRNIIAEGLVIQGVHDKEYINSEVERVLKLVGLVPEHANRYPHEFSGGQRQRIGIARAIIMNPELIVADEPVSALDVSIQAQVINLLNDLRNNLGLTIVFIAHNLSVVKYFCDRIAVMYFGKLVELASSDELFAHPLHPYTKSLLSAVPYPDPNVEASRKRIKYDPKESHDYSHDKPTMKEIAPGHFVYCNSIEEEQYKQELAQGESIYAK